MDQKTIAAYNQLAEAYDRETASFWEKFPKTFLDKFIASAGKKILDVGSGPGREGAMFQDKGFEVTCLDASEKMIAMAQLRGLDGVVADFSAMPFADKSFDAAWAYTCLLHIPKKEISAPLQEINRVLKPGGIFALGMIEGEGEIYRQSSEMDLERLFSFYTKKELEALLEKYGFQIIYFEEFIAGKNNPKNYLNYLAQKIR